MPDIAVFQFTRRDDKTGESVVSRRFATLKAIKMCNGRNIEDTRRVVDTDDLDGNGFYPKSEQ